jgi:hypothetical protein
MSKSFRRFGSSRKIRNIASAIVLILLVGTIIGLVVHFNNTTVTEKMTSTSYSICGLTDKGAEKESKATLVSDYISTDGLTIEVADDAEVEYKVYYYTEDKEFISSSEFLSVDLDTTSIPTNAKYARILIDPTDDDVISILEKSGYVGQLTVTYKK